MKTNIVRKYIGYTGLVMIIFVSFYLLFSVGMGLYLYDIESSDGTDDARWRIERVGWDCSDTVAILMLGFYLLVIGVHLFLFFKRLSSMEKFNMWALPTFNIEGMRILSCFLSVMFILFVFFFDTTLPEIFTPSVSILDYKEMDQFVGIDSFSVLLISLVWIVFTLFTSLHLLLYMITQKNKEANK